MDPHPTVWGLRGAFGMSMMFHGQCLCGGVKITVTAAKTAPKLRACHCDMCRRHTSGAFFSVQFEDAQFEIAGEVAEYSSSEWATRGFCPTCGSTLWYSTKHDGFRSFAAGLFDDAAGGAMVQEFFADKCPQGYMLAGDHPKLSTTETIALFAPDEGEI